jgi:hypothetical protein
MYQIIQVQVLDIAIGVLTPTIAVGHNFDHGPDEPSGIEFLTERIPHIADRDRLLLLPVVVAATLVLAIIATTGQ